MAQQIDELAKQLAKLTDEDAGKILALLAQIEQDEVKKQKGFAHLQSVIRGGDEDEDTYYRWFSEGFDYAMHLVNNGK